jgi:hypothetical protein
VQDYKEGEEAKSTDNIANDETRALFLSIGDHSVGDGYNYGANIYWNSKQLLSRQELVVLILFGERVEMLTMFAALYPRPRITLGTVYVSLEIPLLATVQPDRRLERSQI